MNKIKISLVISSVLAILASGCGSNSNNENTKLDDIKINSTVSENNSNKAKWTVMVYMSGDNDLEEYIVKDLENELASPGSTNNVQVVAVADRTPGYDKSRGDWTSTKLFHVTKGMKATAESAVSDWGERNFGDPKTLTDFVSWSKEHYPAEHYALYMWGHGYSWHQGFTMEDKTNKDSLDPDEIKSVFPKLGAIDVIAYDGCNMGAIEVEALWHNHAKAIVHSQEYVEWDGIEYDVVLKKLNENPDMNADQLAIITNQSASLNKEKTGSAVALDQRWDKLQTAVDQWSIALKNGLNTNRKAYETAFKNSQHFWDAPDDADLYDFADKISKNVSDPVIKEKSKAVMDAVKSATLNQWHINEKEYQNAHGITISKVPAKAEDKAYYKSSDFAKNTNWDEFLDAYKN